MRRQSWVGPRGRGALVPLGSTGYRNQKHLRLDFLESSFAGSLLTGEGSCLAGGTGPAAGELCAASPSMWLSTRWKRPSCCRKSCSTLRGEGAA